MNITLLQLRAFVAVSRYGSFTLAADFLNRTQPAVTVQVKQLEDALGLRLFDRTTRQLRLTSVGLALVPVLSDMLQQLDSVIEASHDLRAIRAGIVRIGCLPSVAANFLPPKIAQFRVLFPGISFFLNDSLGDKVIEKVKSGEVEFGITDTHSTESELLVEPLFEENMCVLFLKSHPIQDAAVIDIEELSKHDLILMSQGTNARRIVDSAFAEQGRLPIARCEASYMSTAVGMVQAGLGVALLPVSGVQLQIDSRLQCRVLESSGFTRAIALVQQKNKSLSPAASAFIKTLRVDAICPELFD